MDRPPESNAPAANAGRWRAAAASALVAVSLCLYARTLDYEFVDWDDIPLVLENPQIRAVSLENLRAIWTGPLPLQASSFLIDYAIWELEPFGYHLHSVLLNAAISALALWILLQLTSPAIALLAVLLFTVHPSHVEATAWVSARKELTFTAFLLLSTGAYLRARREAAFSVPAYAASVGLFTLGVAAKMTIVAFPLFFLLVDRILDARLEPERRRSLAFHAVTKLPYLVFAAPLVWINLRVQPTSDWAMAGDLASYVLAKGHAAWRYGWVLLGLLPGQPMYDPPPIRLQPVWAAATLAPLVIPPAAWLWGVRRGQTNAALALAWGMLGLLAPLVFPLTTFMADRYLYASSLGFCWLLATGIVNLSNLAVRPRAWNVAVAALLIAPLLLWFAALTWNYTPVWRNSEALWTYAAAHSRDGRAATALSRALIQQRRFEEAERVLTGSETLGANGYLHLAIVYLEQNRVEDALRASDQAIALGRIRPPSPRDAAKLMWIHGVALAKLDRDEEAMRAWEAALRFDPDNAEARASLDQALAK